MHVGMAAVFQNPGKARTDRDVYGHELRLADLAEPAGFRADRGVGGPWFVSVDVRVGWSLAGVLEDGCHSTVHGTLPLAVVLLRR